MRWLGYAIDLIYSDHSVNFDTMNLRLSLGLFSLITVLLLMGIPSICNAQFNPDPMFPPETGSGSIFGQGVHMYSTTLYNTKGATLTRSERQNRKTMERGLRKKRRRLIHPSERQMKLEFVNYSKMTRARFRAEVDKQIAALERDFTMAPQIYKIITGEEDVRQADLEVFKFIRLGGSYRPEEIVWEDWTSIAKPRSGPPDKITICVVEDLPDRLGHGYAQYKWIDRPELPDIVIRASSFGSGSGDFDQGKVLTHLFANYLGLLPLTGLGACEDDGVSDTPIHNAAVNFCRIGDTPISLCDSQPFLLNNYMSHTPDACKDSFTAGQWRRIITIINQDEE